MDTLKRELLLACNRYVDIRIGRIMDSISDLENALKLETKCSAGDKYETGRAMLHLEFEKYSIQLEQYRRLKRTLKGLNAGSRHLTVGFGSVVQTSKANYFIAIPAGEIQLENEVYFAVGTSAPIAKELLGKNVGETFQLNGSSGEITALL